MQPLTVTSAYGAIRQYDTGPGRHTGVDLDGEGGELVLASAGGRVVLGEPLQVRGGTVILDHGLGVYSTYCHLSELEVSVGDVVSRGQAIGYLGSTGLSTGPHVCFRVKQDGTYVDPMKISGPAGAPVTASRLPLFRSVRDQLLADLGDAPLAMSDEAL